MISLDNIVKFLILINCIIISFYANAENKFTINVPYAPGGWSDRLARIISSQETNSIVINTINKTSQQIFDSSYLNKQLVVTGMGISVTDNIFQKNNYDIQKKFYTIIIGHSPNVFLVNKSLNVNNVNEFKKVLESKKIDFRFSSSSSFSHISSEEFLSVINVSGRVISYKSGGSQSVLAVLNNDVHLVSTNLTTSQSLIRGKLLTPIAINTEHRIKEFPNLLTIKEQLGESLLSKSYSFVNIPKSFTDDEFNYWKKTIKSIFQTENILEIMEKNGIQVELIYGEKNINDWYKFQIEFYTNIIKKYNISQD